MTSKEAFDSLFSTIVAIDDGAIKTPTMDRKDMIVEAEELKIIAGEDKEKLVLYGINVDYIDTLDDRIGAYAHAAADYETAAEVPNAAKAQWDEVYPQIHKFKTDCIEDIVFALRNDPTQLSLAKRIAAGIGKVDTIMDCKDIKILGNKNTDALKKINFDLTKLDKCGEYFELLSNLLADVNTNPKMINNKKIISFKAYTYLSEAVDSIREHGQHIFRNDPERLEKYKSSFYMEKRRNSATKAKSEEVLTEMAAS